MDKLDIKLHGSDTPMVVVVVVVVVLLYARNVNESISRGTRMP